MWKGNVIYCFHSGFCADPCCHYLAFASYSTSYLSLLFVLWRFHPEHFSYYIFKWNFFVNHRIISIWFPCYSKISMRFSCSCFDSTIYLSKALLRKNLLNFRFGRKVSKNDEEIKERNHLYFVKRGHWTLHHYHHVLKMNEGENPKFRP